MTETDHQGQPRPVAAANDLHRLEIDELTSMMRSEQVFAAVRRGLAAHGLATETSLMVGFVEGEDGAAHGAVVAPGPRILVFEGPAPAGLVGIAPDDWQETTVAQCAEHFPLVHAGLRLL